MLSNVQLCKFSLVASVAFSLAACESSGSYRLASVGNVPDGTGSSSSSGGDGTASSSSGGSGSSSGGGSTASSSGGGTGSSSSGGQGALGSNNILVTAGNTVIGVAGNTRKISGGVLLPATGLVTGTVTRILRKTGQTLVDIGQGNTLILGKAGGAVGDLLRIDLGSHTVIGAPSKSALLGVGVLSPAGSGNLVAVSLNKALDLTASTTGGLLNGGLTSGGLLSNSTGALTGAVGTTASTPAGSANAGAATAVTSTVGAVTGTVGGVVNGVTSTTGILGAGTTGSNGGLLGTGLLGGKKTK